MVTASESAHILGQTPKYWAMDEEQLAERKLSGEEFKPNAVMCAGTFWEPFIADYIHRATGIFVQPSSALYQHEEHSFLGATPDGYAVLDAVPGAEPRVHELVSYLTVVHNFEVYRGEEALEKLYEALVGQKNTQDGLGYQGLVEIKNQESKRRSKWYKEEGPPHHYYCQVQHQLCVMGAEVGLLVAKVDANELYVHVVEADPLMHELLVDSCRDFCQQYLDTA